MLLLLVPHILSATEYRAAIIRTRRNRANREDYGMPHVDDRGITHYRG